MRASLHFHCSRITNMISLTRGFSSVCATIQTPGGHVGKLTARAASRMKVVAGKRCVWRLSRIEARLETPPPTDCRVRPRQIQPGGGSIRTDTREDPSHSVRTHRVSDAKLPTFCVNYIRQQKSTDLSFSVKSHGTFLPRQSLTESCN